MNKLLLLFFALATDATSAQGLESFIKQDNPTVLNYWYAQNQDCPWYEEEAKRSIDRAISLNSVRAENKFGSFYLDVTAACLELEVVNTLTVMFNVSVGKVSLLFAKKLCKLGRWPACR